MIKTYSEWTPTVLNKCSHFKPLQIDSNQKSCMSPQVCQTSGGNYEEYCVSIHSLTLCAVISYDQVLEGVLPL